MTEELNTNLEDDPTGGINTPGISAEDAESLTAGDIPPATEPKKDGVQQRIDKLTREKYEAERKAEYYRGMAEAKPAPAKGNGEAVVDGPDRDDFLDDADYIRAVAEQRKKIREAAQQETRRQELARVQETFLSQIKDARERHSDFDEVALTQGTHIVTQVMIDAALGDKCGDILYYLGKNRTEANRIATLPPSQQAKEIGKIEARLASKPAPKQTNTPNPPTILKGGGSDSNKAKKDAAEMSRAERFKKWEEDRLKGR